MKNRKFVSRLLINFVIILLIILLSTFALINKSENKDPQPQNQTPFVDKNSYEMDDDLTIPDLVDRTAKSVLSIVVESNVDDYY